MSIAQTDQLIRLILNSLLLVVICTIALQGLLNRHGLIVQQLRVAQREFSELSEPLDHSGIFKQNRYVQHKQHLRQLRQQYRTTYFSLLVAQAALLVCLTSTLMLAFRTLINFDWLIHASLVLFLVGVIGLLSSAGLVLIHFYTANYSLWEELHPMLSANSAVKQLRSTNLNQRRSRRAQAAASAHKRAANP
ncbi:MAG: hypothetical protein Kow00121_48780 [Elainellaceae cyanobacterium]